MHKNLKSAYHPEQFQQSSPELAYFLGFLWGDGYLHKFPKTGQCTISIEILSTDMTALRPHFDRFCKWLWLPMIKKKLSQNTFSRIYSGDRAFYQYLSSLGFLNKEGSQAKALEILSEKDHPHFFRGLLDADGSIGKYKGYCVVSFTSEYDQDWSSLYQFCESIGVKPHLDKRENVRKNGKTYRHSMFWVGGESDFHKFLDAIYGSAEQDKIYLPRKYAIQQEIRRRVFLGLGGDVFNRDFKAAHQ